MVGWVAPLVGIADIRTVELSHLVFCFICSVCVFCYANALWVVLHENFVNVCMLSMLSQHATNTLLGGSLA